MAARYAEIEDVLARLGLLAPAVRAGATPGPQHVDAFLDEVSSTVELALSSAGAVVPATDENVLVVLRDIVASAVALQVLDTRWPGGEGGAQVSDLRASLRQKLGLDEGQGINSETVGGLIEWTIETDVSTPTGAKTFWTQNPDYPTPADWLRARRNPDTAPLFARGERG